MQFLYLIIRLEHKKIYFSYQRYLRSRFQLLNQVNTVHSECVAFVLKIKKLLSQAIKILYSLNIYLLSSFSHSKYMHKSSESFTSGILLRSL